MYIQWNTNHPQTEMTCYYAIPINLETNVKEVRPEHVMHYSFMRKKSVVDFSHQELLKGKGE